MMQTSLSSRAGLLPRLFAGTAAVTRSSRRLGRTGLFTAETLSRLSWVQNNAPEDALARARHLAWVAENLCAAHGVQVVVRGEFPDEPSVLVANHLSYIDPLAILAQVPSTAVAKNEVAEWPFIGDALRGLGVLFVDRSCAMSGARCLRSAQRALRGGVSVLGFPEGTTTVGDRVLPFRRGLFGIAQIEDAPIVPIALRYESTEPCWIGEQAFLPHYVRTTARAHTRVFLSVGTPLLPRKSDRAEELATKSRASILRMLDLNA